MYSLQKICWCGTFSNAGQNCHEYAICSTALAGRLQSGNTSWNEKMWHWKIKMESSGSGQMKKTGPVLSKFMLIRSTPILVPLEPSTGGPGLYQIPQSRNARIFSKFRDRSWGQGVPGLSRWEATLSNMSFNAHPENLSHFRAPKGHDPHPLHVGPWGSPSPRQHWPLG